ncbi:MAG TPA: thiol peroxidase [Bryobacteraceae bacterium]|nr:thiol peroxidase [Bryobacteraceae bacterium]
MERPGAITVQGRPFALVGPELKPGDTAPDFHLVDSSNKPVKLEDTEGRVRIFSVVPSLDTPICDAQTRRFNIESEKLPGVDVYNVSMDLPFAQKRWCGQFAVDRVRMLSDHREASFGVAWGTLIQELRLESRAIFVVGKDNVIRYVEYVKELTDHPDYDSALAAVQETMTAGA